MTLIPGPECLCSLNETESIVAFNSMCPDHKELAPKRSTLIQRWCSGSSMPGSEVSRRTGRCHACGNEVPMKYGITGVHLPDGSTPRE